MPERILIVGASARAAAASAARGGMRVLAADLFADQDLRATSDRTDRIENYPLDIEPILAKRNFDRWMITGALENHVGLVEQWSQQFPGYCGCSPDAIRNVRGEQWRTALRGNGVRVPDRPNKVVESGSKWLRKSSRSSGGMHVEFSDHFHSTDEMQFLEEYIPGVPVSGVFLADEEQAQLIGVSEQLSGHEMGGPLPFAYVGSIGPLKSNWLGKQFARIGKIIAKDCGMLGIFGVDAILHRGESRNESIVPIEVNPRFPASAEIYEMAHPNLSLVRSHIAACNSDASTLGSVELSNHEFAPSVFAKAIVWAQRESIVSPGAIEKIRETGVDIADVPQAANGTQSVTISNGQPILTVFANENSRTETLQTLQKNIRTVRQIIASLAD